MDPSRRWSASALLEKSLFSTKSSTAAAHDLKSSKEELRVVAAQLFAIAARNEAAGVSASVSSEEIAAMMVLHNRNTLSVQDKSCSSYFFLSHSLSVMKKPLASSSSLSS